MELKPGTEEKYAKYQATNASDPYSARVVSYGEDWAAAMEAAITLGATVTECAEKASRDADTDGITGYMYGAAASALSHFWKHGEELRAWHNRKYMPEDRAAECDKTGAVANPAILEFGA